MVPITCLYGQQIGGVLFRRRELVGPVAQSGCRSSDWSDNGLARNTLFLHMKIHRFRAIC